MKKCFLILPLIFGFVSFCYSTPEQFLINSGHLGAINDLKYDEQRNLLFSAGEDGHVNIWDPQTNRLVSSLAVSRDAIQQIAIHPKTSQVAILETKGAQYIKISVWDWEKNRELFLVNLTEAPLYMGYSTQGTYLVLSRADWKSLSIYESQSGRLLPLMPEGFGIVSYLTFSLSEKNIMTYQPSGRITYWEVQSGKFIKSLASVPNLTGMRITQNRRFMAAVNNEKLMVIDVLTGEVKAVTPLTDVVSIDIGKDDKTIICLTRHETKTGISIWSFENDKLTSLSQPSVELDPGIKNLVISSDEMYMGDYEGSITAVSFLGDKRLISENRILPVSGLALYDDNIFIASEQGILHFQVNLSAAENITSYLFTNMNIQENYKTIPNPYGTAIGLTLINKDRLIIWDKSDKAKGFVIYDLKESKIVQEDKGLTSPLTQVSVRGDNLLLLEKNGQLRILNVQTLAKVFSYFVPGMNRVIFVSDSTLVGGKTKGSGNSEPLMMINLKTGETVSLPDASILNYDLAYDPLEDTLYTLSLEKYEDINSTAILMHYGKDYEQTKLIMRYPNEDYTASLIFEPVSRKLYTSLGYNLVQTWEKSFFAFSTLEKSEHPPRKLEISQNLLISLNENHSITIWNLKDKKIILHFYLFKELNWVAVFPHNQNKYLSKNTNVNAGSQENPDSPLLTSPISQ